jgi:hypothetical protein
MELDLFEVVPKNQGFMGAMTLKSKGIPMKSPDSPANNKAVLKYG